MEPGRAVTRRSAVSAAALLLAGTIAWQAGAFQAAEPAAVTNTAELPDDPAPLAKAPKAAAQPTRAAAPQSTAVTPMRDRVAVIGLLNKRNGLWRDLTLKPGQGVRIDGVEVRLRACEATAPWEPQRLTGAFVQLDVREGAQLRRVFSGWLFKESPSLNMVEHPVWDVWTKSCAMTYPDAGPDTVSISSNRGGGGGSSRSSAAKSAPADTASAEPTAAPAPTPSASSNSTE